MPKTKVRDWSDDDENDENQSHHHVAADQGRAASLQPSAGECRENDQRRPLATLDANSRSNFRVVCNAQNNSKAGTTTTAVQHQSETASATLKKPAHQVNDVSKFQNLNDSDVVLDATPITSPAGADQERTLQQSKTRFNVDVQDDQDKPEAASPPLAANVSISGGNPKVAERLTAVPSSQNRSSGRREKKQAVQSAGTGKDSPNASKDRLGKRSRADECFPDDPNETIVNYVQERLARKKAGTHVEYHNDDDWFLGVVEAVLCKVLGILADPARAASLSRMTSSLDIHFGNLTVTTWVSVINETQLVKVIKEYPGLTIFYGCQGPKQSGVDDDGDGVQAVKETTTRNFVRRVMDDSWLHKEWSSRQGACCFCNRQRCDGLRRVMFSKSPTGTDTLPPAAGDDAETVSYATVGGRCLYRIRLLHCLHHFKTRLTAALKRIIKDKLWSRYAILFTDYLHIDVSSQIKQVVNVIRGDSKYIGCLRKVYEQLCKAASNMHKYESVNRAGHRATDGALEAWDACMALHPDLEARELDLQPDPGLGFDTELWQGGQVQLGRTAV